MAYEIEEKGRVRRGEGLKRDLKVYEEGENASYPRRKRSLSRGQS